MKEVRGHLIPDRGPGMEHQPTPHPRNGNREQRERAETQDQHPKQQVVLLDQRLVHDELYVER